MKADTEEKVPSSPALLKETFFLYRNDFPALFSAATLALGSILLPMLKDTAIRMLPEVNQAVISLGSGILSVVCFFLSVAAALAVVGRLNAPDERIGAIIKRSLKKCFGAAWILILFALGEMLWLALALVPQLSVLVPQIQIPHKNLFLIFIIPFAVAGVWSLFMLYAYTQENVRGSKALLRSRDLVRGRWWGMFEHALMVLILLSVPGLLVRASGLLENAATSPEPMHAIWGRFLPVAIISVIALSFVLSYLFVLYKKASAKAAPVPQKTPYKRPAYWMFAVSAALGYAVVYVIAAARLSMFVSGLYGH